MRVDTTQFEAAHGRKPRGAGHWMFFFDNDDNIMHAFEASGMFSDCKQQAVKEAKRQGKSVVHVGS